ncbi:MAG: MerR family DNA-binding protein [Fibrobacteres bacterium]|nr:MerR family DNA-binding protein [Fibrobacterota bacterium]
MVKGAFIMLIGELSKRTGLSRDTIRFYEKEDLIRPEKSVRQGFFSNNYKNYPESVVSTLLVIQRAKALGFTLSEIRDMLALQVDGKLSQGKWVAEAKAKLVVIDRKIEELQELKTLLADVLARCIDRCFDEGCGILDEAVARKKTEAVAGIGASVGPRPANGNANASPCRGCE